MCSPCSAWQLICQAAHEILVDLLTSLSRSQHETRHGSSARGDLGQSGYNTTESTWLKTKRQRHTRLYLLGFFAPAGLKFAMDFAVDTCSQPRIRADRDRNFPANHGSFGIPNQIAGLHSRAHWLFVAYRGPVRNVDVKKHYVTPVMGRAQQCLTGRWAVLHSAAMVRGCALCSCCTPLHHSSVLELFAPRILFWL